MRFNYPKPPILFLTNIVTALEGTQLYFLFTDAHVESMLANYENTPMQYTAIFHGCKNLNFQIKM